MPVIDWKNSRVIVTGGSGFLGSVVCRKLRERGAREIFVPRSAQHDLREQAGVRRMFDDFGTPEVLIHLAARVGGIGANRKNPGAFFHDNMAMGLHLMEESRIRGVAKVVNIGTVCAYPKYTPVPFHENDLWNGYPEETNAPYGIAKKALLVMGQGYRAQYGMDVIYLLPVNLYGPGDNFDPESSHVIPALIRKFLEARDTNEPEVVCWGTGSPSREFLYVDDAAEGIVLAAERYDGAEPVNLGTHREISIKDLSETIARLVGYNGRIVWDHTKPDGQPRRCLDTSRAMMLFGFRAQMGFEEGLRRTIAWWESHRPEYAGT